MYQAIEIRIALDFLIVKLDTRNLKYCLQIWKDNDFQLRILYPAKLPIKYEGPTFYFVTCNHPKIVLPKHSFLGEY